MSEAAQLRRGLKPKGKTYGLTNQKRREIREIFDLFDIDGSGKLLNRFFIRFTKLLLT